MIDWKSKYVENISDYIGDNSTEKHKMLVNQWAEKWLAVEDIIQDEADWIKIPNAMPILKPVRKVRHTDL